VNLILKIGIKIKNQPDPVYFELIIYPVETNLVRLSLSLRLSLTYNRIGHSAMKKNRACEESGDAGGHLATLARKQDFKQT
jgi:hypothetical protein